MICPVNYEHERLKRDTSQWRLLPLVGTMSTEFDDGTKSTLELRNCACGSTLAREVQS